MQLNTVPLNSDIKITNIAYKFRRHHQGRLATQRGTAVRLQTHELLDATIPESPISQQTSIVFSIPTLMVSPTFSSRHVRTTYDLLLRVTMEETHFLKRSTTFHCECSIPIHIANLPYDEMMRIPDLISIERYTQSKLSPFFYDQDEANSISSPPGYYAGHDRQERTVYWSMQTSPKLNSNGCSAVTPTTTTSNVSLINGNGGTGGGGLMGCSSTSHHQRGSSLPDIGEANIILSSSGEWS